MQQQQLDQQKHLKPLEIDQPMPQFDLTEFKKKLENCRYFIYAHCTMSLLGFFIYEVRRLFFILVINFISLCLAMLGLYSNTYFNKFLTAVYSIFTSSLFGMLIVYQIIDHIFAEQYENESISQTQMLFILTIPYVIDLLSGLRSLLLTLEVFSLKDIEIYWKYDSLQVRRKEIEPSQEEQNMMQKQIADQRLCVICMNHSLNTVFYKCGHKAVCMPCYDTMRKKGQNNCPICRQKILDCIMQFDL